MLVEEDGEEEQPDLREVGVAIEPVRGAVHCVELLVGLAAAPRQDAEVGVATLLAVEPPRHLIRDRGERARQRP